MGIDEKKGRRGQERRKEKEGRFHDGYFLRL